MKKTIGILLCAVLTVAASGFAFPAKAQSGVRVGFTIIPTKIVSAKSSVELRAGLTNETASPKTVTVEFLEDGGAVKTVSEVVPKNGYKISSHWWSAAGKKGCKVLGIRVKQSGAVVAEEYRVITVLDIGTVGPEIATVAWEEPLAFRDGTYKALRAIKKADVVNQIEDMYNLGIDTIIFTYAEFIYYNTGAFYDSKLPALTQGVFKALSYDLLDTTLKAAQDRGMNVIVGIGRGRDLFTPTKEPEFTKAVNLAVDVMEEIYGKYGHYKSFYGWYMTHEPTRLSDTGNGELRFFNTVVSKVRRNWPDKPVLIAPTGTPVLDEAAMKASQVDIFAFQDAVGPGYMPGVYTYNPENRIAELHSVFSSYKPVMDRIGKHFWSDLESWEMKGPNYENPYPALWSRVKRQFDIEKNYVSTHSMYAYTGFLSSPASTVQIGGEKAVDLYNAYFAHAKKYMSDHGIHNHTIKTSEISLTSPDIRDASTLPSIIEVKLSGCNKVIKVPVVWGKPEVSGQTAAVTGTVNVPGIKSAKIKATVKKAGGDSKSGPSGGFTQSGDESSKAAQSGFHSSAPSDALTNSAAKSSAVSESSESSKSAGASPDQSPKPGGSSLLYVLAAVLVAGAGTGGYFLYKAAARKAK